MTTTHNSGLTVRRLHIDLKQGFGRRWCGGDAFMSAYLNAFSMSFPAGEQLFIDAVKSGSKALGDAPEHAQLQGEIKHFIGQEATHRHLHAQYNAILAQQGFVNHWEPRLQKRLQVLRTQRLSKSKAPWLHELAITAALEHYTAILGDLVLERVDQPGDWLRGAQEPLKTLWRWHAAEESEHKCVAFDLYQALGGSHQMRVRWFVLVSIHLMLDLTRQTLNNLWHDGSLHKPSTWWSAGSYLLGRHGVVWRSFKPLVAYFKKDFHPLKVGQQELSQQWLAAHQDQWSPVKQNPSLGKV